VVVDARNADRFQAIRSVAHAAATARVLAVGVPEDEAVPCFEAGAAGFVDETFSVDDLVTAVCACARGELLCTSRLAFDLARRVSELAASAHASHECSSLLTARELEIVALIDGGLSDRAIAERLVIQVRTVKTHVHNVLRKLDVHTRGEAAALVAGRASRSARRQA
jgi:DNA-binding NarL/FixJ family response regulator